MVVSAVDSIKARKEIWHNFIKDSSVVEFYVDTRMGAEQLILFAVDPLSPEDSKFYEAHLFPESEVEQERCSAKSIMYTPVVIAGIAASTLKKKLMNQLYHRYFQLGLPTNNLSTMFPVSA